MAGLNGLRLALLETRQSGELAALVRRLGGIASTAPSVREVPHLEQVPAFLDALDSHALSVVICETGVGVQRLLDEAERLGRLDRAVTALQQLTTVCRGPKPSAVLRRYKIPVSVSCPEPYTSRELLASLSAVDLEGRSVALLHYGETNQPLADALRERGARLHELCLYEWKLPEDVRPLQALVSDLIHGRFDAVVFTSQIQCRHLFDVANTLGLSSQLADALREDVIVAAIGPVCASALRTYGVTPDVLPAHPKMGALMTALGEYVELTNDSSR